ncbi:acetolactate decarboxylase [Dokdonia sp. MED134]|uniref:acetolactate decarboxylase n=1 Tax=Dokdonia sp. MED134 TaxID=313590 RepID=UPI000068A7F9|nr:acetolactate decarboxylase [Dokdonia sp. MED134]
MKYILLLAFTICLASCNSKGETATSTTYPDVKVVGAMKNVMWKGELEGSILLDTITNKKGLYGLGPESYLTGELLIVNSTSYLSKVSSDTAMTVTPTYDVSAPFFVYTNVTDWYEINLPASVKTIKDIEDFVSERTKEAKRPFAFKLEGTVSKAEIHIQNLPRGTKVSSPQEAHQGQTNYTLQDEQVEIIGFFSTMHKGIFTHHDSNIHLHLITKDESKMGHLDNLDIDRLTLFLPKK